MNAKLNIFHINCKVASLLILLFVVLLFIYGLVPFLYINNLSAYYTMYGDTQGLVNNGILTLSYIKNFGIELGSPFVQGLPFTYLSAFVSIVLKVDPYVSNTITGILLLLVAYLSMFYLLKKLEINDYIALVSSYLFLTLNINYGQVGYGTMMYAFILLPFYILIDYLFFSRLLRENFNKYTMVIFCLIYPLEKTFILFFDGYAFMISSLASFSVFAAFLIKYLRSCFYRGTSSVFDNRLFMGVSIFVFANIISVGLYKLYVPGSASYSVMPLDFFRAQGIDLISLIVPSDSRYYFLDLFGLTKSYNGFAFYGDGSNVRSNYLGYTLLLMFLLYFFTKIKRPIFVKSILIAGAVAFFLSLGPSLKFNNTKKDAINKTTITFSDYLMTAKEATLNLHTGFIYQYVPGIKNMRAVQRWMLLFMFSLIMVCAFFLTYLVDKKLYAVAFSLAILSILELQPNLYAMHRGYIAGYERAKEFDKVLNSMKGYSKPYEKVFYLSDQNDYLANYISSKLNVMSYNVAGDKNIDLSSKSWPASIKNMRQYKEVNENAYYAMSNGILNKLIIPFFDLRWHSYYWPPSEADRRNIKQEKLSVFDINDARFIYQEEEWFGVAEIVPEEIMSSSFEDVLLPRIKDKIDRKYIQDRYIKDIGSYKLKEDISGAEMKRISDILIAVQNCDGCRKIKVEYKKIDFSKEKILKKGIIYDFMDISKANKIGDAEESRNPWGRRIALVDIDILPTGKGIFCMPETTLIYNNVYIPSDKIDFVSYIGFHPIASEWKLGDGIKMKVEIIADNQAPETILDKYVLPKDGFLKVKFPLSKFAGKNITFKFSTFNEPGKDGNGDWVVWLEPKLVFRGSERDK